MHENKRTFRILHKIVNAAYFPEQNVARGHGRKKTECKIHVCVIVYARYFPHWTLESTLNETLNSRSWQCA